MKNSKFVMAFLCCFSTVVFSQAPTFNPTQGYSGPALSPPPPPPGYASHEDAIRGRREYVVVATRIDNVRDQKSIFNVASECENNTACVLVMKAASSYFQLPIDKVVSVAAMLSTSREGEGTAMSVKLPSGYTYCKSAMEMVSIVPKDGPRGSLFLGAVRTNGLYLHTWTPVQGIGQGRSWVEAKLTIVGVRDDLARDKVKKGTCQNSDSRNIFYCRGGGCVSTQDRGQNVPSSSPPGASSHN